jgi:hypothetical protein
LTPAIWSRTVSVFDELLTAVMAASGDADTEPTLINAIDGFRQLESDVAAAPPLRPWIDLWAAVNDVLFRLKSIVRHYLLAAAADTPLEAQHESQAAQRELDEAAEPASELWNRMEAWSRVEAAATLEEAIGALAENAFGRSQARNLLEFDRAGYLVYERVSEEKAAVQGLGVGLNIIAEQARGPFDEPRVWRVASETYSLLTGNPDWLATLVTDVVWKSDLKSGLEKLWDAGCIQAAVIAALRHDRQTVRAMLSVVQDLVESTGKRYVATIMAAFKAAAYARYRDQSAGSLLISAEQMGLGSLILGLDRSARVASAHDEFALDGDEVVLMDRGVEVDRLSVEGLVDRVLAGVETTLALGLGILCAAIHGGIESSQLLPDLETLGVQPEEAIAWLLSSSGWREVHVGIEDGVVTASGTGNERILTMAHVAAMIPLVPDECVEVVVASHTPSGLQELRGPLEAFRVFQAAEDELERQAHHVELLRTWARNGTVLIDETQARKILAVLSLESLIPGEERESLLRLRMLRGSARTLGDEELYDALTRLVGGLRSRLMELPSDQFASALNRIAEWAGMRVEPLDTSLMV